MTVLFSRLLFSGTCNVFILGCSSAFMSEAMVTVVSTEALRHCLPFSWSGVELALTPCTGPYLSSASSALTIHHNPYSVG